MSEEDDCVSVFPSLAPGDSGPWCVQMTQRMCVIVTRRITSAMTFDLHVLERAIDA